MGIDVGLYPAESADKTMDKAEESKISSYVQNTNHDAMSPGCLHDREKSEARSGGVTLYAPWSGT
jgi:hypothetical protein